MSDQHKPEPDNVVRCPECGAQVPVDEAQASAKGYVVCPKGHAIALMQSLL
jgi:hypothetical protein